MSTREVRKSEICTRIHLAHPDYLAHRNRGNFSIDPTPQATVDKRRALVKGGI